MPLQNSIVALNPEKVLPTSIGPEVPPLSISTDSTVSRNNHNSKDVLGAESATPTAPATGDNRKAEASNATPWGNNASSPGKSGGEGQDGPGRAESGEERSATTTTNNTNTVIAGELVRKDTMKEGEGGVQKPSETREADATSSETTQSQGPKTGLGTGLMLGGGVYEDELIAGKVKMARRT